MPAGGEMNRQGEKQAVMEPDEYRYKECKNMENKEKCRNGICPNIITGLMTRKSAKT